MTADIKRAGTNVHKFAKMAGDKRRKNGVSRQEVIKKHGFDPAPYAKMYACFVATSRGRYIYTGNALSTIK